MVLQLPIELWWIILRLAVHNPGLFETKWDYSPDTLIWNGWELPDQNYSDSMQTKLSICRVSRSWNDIGTELLYEHLLFTKTDISHFGVISKLVSVFEQHTDQRGYGQSTRRFDVDGEALKQPYFPSFLTLLNLCHNIRIFMLSDQGQPISEQHAELCTLLQNHFNHSLRRAKFGAYGRDIPGIFHPPNVPLDTLELSTGPEFTRDPPLAIATVSTFCLDLLFRRTEPPPWRFPALRHLTLRWIADDDIPFLKSFMSVNGPQIHSLHLAGHEDGNDSELTLLQVLLEPAINLRCLSLSPSDSHWPPAEYSFPSITHIGIRSDHYPEPCDIDQIVLTPIFPGLRCIRFLDHSSPVVPCRDSARKKMWLLLQKAVLERNIRIEDNMCQLIQQFPE